MKKLAALTLVAALAALPACKNKKQPIVIRKEVVNVTEKRISGPEGVQIEKRISGPAAVDKELGGGANLTDSDFDIIVK